MDVSLKQLADASLEVAAAEEALAESAHQQAAERLDAAAAGLAELRAAWPALSAAQRAIVGPSAAAVRRRIDESRARIPRVSALTVGTAVSDPEEETEPTD